MFSFLNPSKKKKLEKQYEKLLLEARDLQRSGNIQEYALKTEEAQKVAEEIQKLDQQKD